MRYLRFAVAALAALLLASAGAGAADASVSVFPVPGSIGSLPGNQIVFRGVAPDRIAPILVVGSRSGVHSGRIAADSDGRGGSFLPSAPFAAGETVTVSTRLDVLGATNGTFEFRIAVPAGPSKVRQLPMVSAGSNGVRHYRSRPDLQPASITFYRRSAPPSFGDIFVAPQFGPAQNGPMLLDASGNLIWFHPLPPNVFAADFRVQRLGSQPVLTWWQGNQTLAGHAGEGVIFDQHYNEIATVRAADGLQGMDLHEFLITPQGQAYIVAMSPLHWPGVTKTLVDSVVQEIDIKTGLVLFEWHAVDHVPFSESFFKPARAYYEYDPYHLNSIALTGDGNMIVSMRNTWADYKLNHRTGAVMWTLGSNRSNFKLGPGAGTAFQHDLTIQPNGAFSIFDDGAGPPAVHSASRAVELSVNTRRKTVRLIKQYTHTPPLLSNYEGGVQILSRGGEAFVGWGQQPYFSEFKGSGKLDFDARFTAPTNSYRAYRFRWSGSPLTQPVLTTRPGASGKTTVYASWNGALEVVWWRVFAGPSRGVLAAVSTARKGGFETAISVPSRQPCFQVQALSSSGAVLSTSRAVCV